jgi:hypothetical protein
LLQNWCDKGVLSVLSTKHAGVSGFERNYYGGATVPIKRLRKEGTWSRKDCLAPEACFAYQRHYFGVDRHDRVSSRTCVHSFCLRVCLRLNRCAQNFVASEKQSVGTFVCGLGP